MVSCVVAIALGPDTFMVGMQLLGGCCGVLGGCQAVVTTPVSLKPCGRDRPLQLCDW